MRCPNCRHENEEGANFCEECAAPLARAFAKCGHRLSPTAKFCPEYAHPTGVLPEALPAVRFTAPSRREDPHLKERPRGRAQAGHVLFADLNGLMEPLGFRAGQKRACDLDLYFVTVGEFTQKKCSCPPMPRPI